MANVDGITLMMAIQAVNEQIKKYEELLTSETLRDREEIELLVLSYEKAATVLREAYENEWIEGGNLPLLNKIVQKEHSKENPIDNSDIDFAKVDALTDEEIEERAKNDPDSLPFSEAQLKKIKIVRKN